MDEVSVVSLTHPIARHWNWLGDTLRREPEEGFLAETGVDWPKHGFTHVDAPCHMVRGSLTLDECGLDQLLWRGGSDRCFGSRAGEARHC